MSIEIHALPVLKDNYTYVLVDLETRECALVDPGEAAPVAHFVDLNGLEPVAILCTHHHPDHIAGVAELAEKYDATVWASEIDHERVPDVTNIAEEDVPFRLLKTTMRVLEVPGHTQGQVVYWFPDLQAAFTGDTLFSGGCGRLFEGTPEQMHESLRKIAELPRETKLYFGHEYTLRNLEFILSRLPAEQSVAVREYETLCKEKLEMEKMTTPTTLSTELAINPFLYAKSVEEFAEWRQARDNW